MNKYSNHTKELVVLVLIVIGIIGFILFSATHYEDCMGGILYRASEEETGTAEADSGPLLPDISDDLTEAESVEAENSESVAESASEAPTETPETETVAASVPDVTAAPVPDSGFSVTFLDVGQGDAALLSCDGMTMLIDGGGPEKAGYISAYLRARGISFINYIVATHPHSDHVGGLTELFNGIGVGQVYVPMLEYDGNAEFKSFMQYVNATGTPVAIPEVGGVFYLGGAEVQVLGPIAEDPSEMNNNSLVLRVRYGTTSFMFSGDAGAAEEESIVQAGFELKSDVLKVGHHGGSDSNSEVFLNAVHPSSAIISCAAVNDYGHPSAETLARLDNIGCIYYETFLSGCITAMSDGTNITWNFEK